MSEAPVMELREFQIANNGTNLIGYGKIYGDIRGRFVDGQDVHTSYITEIDFEVKTIRTRNSFYKVDEFRGGIITKFLDGGKQS